MNINYKPSFLVDHGGLLVLSFQYPQVLPVGQIEYNIIYENQRSEPKWKVAESKSEQRTRYVANIP